MKNYICIICPAGCHLEIDENLLVTGNKCIRGKDYAISEFKNPKRILTTTIKTMSSDIKRLPVKSSSALPKDLLFECMKIINSKIIDKNVKIGDIIITDILNTGINIIATKSIQI
jgi:CxxC motif-containing protein